jgi:hypothetical protein
MPTTKSKGATKRKPGDITPRRRHPNLTEPWKPGQSGNPAGRPRGSRNKINEYFLRDLQALWEESGDTILRQTAASKPEVIVKAMVGLLPKQVEASNPLGDISDEQLRIIADELLAKYGDPRKDRLGVPPARTRYDGRGAPAQPTQDGLGSEQHTALEHSSSKDKESVY